MTQGKGDADRTALERATGDLFSELWGPYDQQLFEESVALFQRRLELANFDLGWFRGKKCLDAGCGGGRNSIAMARLGAASVIGIDVGDKGLRDAHARARDLDNVEFRTASVLELPFEEGSFDLIWCAGVVMHTYDPDRALRELYRVLAPGGYLYLLVYNTGGMRWPLMNLLRPIAGQLGANALEQAIDRAELPANKRRTILDDLLVPEVDQFLWSRLERALTGYGFEQLDRWGRQTRLDHEHSLADYVKDLEAYLRAFEAGRAGDQAELFAAGADAIRGTLRAIAWFRDQVERGLLTEDDAMARVIGDGHHRVLCRKPTAG